MIRIILIVIGIIFLFGCKESQNQSIKTDYAKSIIQKEEMEDFTQFILRFGKEKEFQLSRINKTWNKEYLNAEFELIQEIKENTDWEYINFVEGLEYFPIIRNLEFDELNLRKKILEFKGLENGIQVAFIFELKDRMWYLIEYSDQST